MKPIISASILNADFSRLADQIHQAEAAGVDWIHIDVMDGHFVPPITMGSLVVEACRRCTQLPIDVHLMIEKPELQLEAFASAGANGISVQQETCPHLHRTLGAIRQLGCRSGVALNPSTPEGTLQYVLPDIDLVLVMTVNPGYGAQTFISGMLEKIARVNGMLADSTSSAFLQVDGGINPDTIRLVQAAGATSFVAGSAIFNNKDGIAAGVTQLKNNIIY